jgi:hypothetical protein
MFIARNLFELEAFESYMSLLSRKDAEPGRGGRVSDVQEVSDDIEDNRAGHMKAEPVGKSVRGVRRRKVNVVQEAVHDDGIEKDIRPVLPPVPEALRNDGIAKDIRPVLPPYDDAVWGVTSAIRGQAALQRLEAVSGLEAALQRLEAVSKLEAVSRPSM